jgi:uncharacterized protein (UPF0332 family)
VRVAEEALAGGSPDAAAARAFYALLYAAKAMLNERGIRLRTHARIAAAVEPPLRDALTDAIARRRSAEAEITYADAETLVARALVCVTAAREKVAAY